MNKITNTTQGRAIGHAALAFLSVLVPLLVFTSVTTLKASIAAALPAALNAAFSAFTGPNVSAQENPPK